MPKPAEKDTHIIRVHTLDKPEPPAPPEQKVNIEVEEPKPVREPENIVNII